MDYDIAIIGLGPAGAVLAKHISKDMRVIALDKKAAAGGGFAKPCGGMLAPDAQSEFSRFDMTLPKDILVDPQIFSVKTIDLDSGLVRYYQRYYVNLDRDRFDRWLIRQIPPRVTLIQNAACTAVARMNGGFRVTYSKDGMAHTFDTRYVVGADGANSFTRRALYPSFTIRKFLSIQQWFTDAHPTPFYSCVFDSKLTDSYAWGLTKDGSFVFGGAFEPKTAKRDFEALKQKLMPYGFKLDKPLKTEACMVLRPFGPWNHCCGTDGAFFIGEAAGFISPSSLEGISYALRSAYILSQCLNNSLNPNRAYRAGTRKIRLSLFAKYIKLPFMYNPFLRRLVLQSGVTSIKLAQRDTE